jgi:hypothetical protein
MLRPVASITMALLGLAIGVAGVCWAWDRIPIEVLPVWASASLLPDFPFSSPLFFAWCAACVGVGGATAWAGWTLARIASD